MKKYGLIGFPLGHSFSRGFFRRKFGDEGIDADYINFEISDICMLTDIVRDNPDLCGLNVTIPYKTQVIALLDELDNEAEQIGAVNVIKFIRRDDSLKLKGFNSDIAGFSESLRPFLKPSHRKALILGTGGASKAVFHGLKQLAVEPTFVSRSKRNDTLTYDEITPQIIKQHTVIVNTTPLGMFPHTDESPSLPYSALTNEHLLFDLIYNPAETQFLKKGKSFGAKTVNGSQMLELQALEAWKIWNY
ncbi:MAG: shikimate dehydrogenase [Tannerella sp.]|jgi:shikimate dehydrogenase|nr:shikimate dehydrogenase [Tannerella sp.]